MGRYLAGRFDQPNRLFSCRSHNYARRSFLPPFAHERAALFLRRDQDELAGAMDLISSNSSDSEQGALTLQRKRTASMAFSDREGGEANPVTSPCSSGPPLTAEPSKEPRPDGPLHKRPRGRAPNGTNGLSMQWSGTKEGWVDSVGSKGVRAKASMEGGPKDAHGRRDTSAYINLAVSKTFEGTPAHPQLLEPPATQAETALLISRSTLCCRARHFQGQDRRVQPLDGLSHPVRGRRQRGRDVQDAGAAPSWSKDPPR